jgi:hypothetical protein
MPSSTATLDWSLEVWEKKEDVTFIASQTRALPAAQTTAVREATWWPWLIEQPLKVPKAIIMWLTGEAGSWQGSQDPHFLPSHKRHPKSEAADSLLFTSTFWNLVWKP